MKKLLFLLLLASFHCVAQDKPIKIERIDTVQGTKNELFVKASKWVALTYNSAKDVIQMQDKDAGIIVAKGNFVVTENYLLSSGDYIIDYTMTIEVKDNRYKVLFSDFILKEIIYTANTEHYNASLDGPKPGGLSGVPGKCWRDAKDEVIYESKKIRKSLSKAMHTENAEW